MAISIEEISVRNLGPLREFNQKLRKINLIYGHNEKGKTLLVEFIIRSLFRNSRTWSLREIFGDGSISISGLERKTIRISQKSPKKLEDYWELSNKEFPQDMSKLLVVRAAEVELSDEYPSGIGKKILLEFLSGKGVIDSIQKKIKGVLKKANVENGEIIGAIENGIKKELSKMAAEIEKVDGKFAKINLLYSQGKIQELKKEENGLRAKFRELKKAKYHSAYLCNQESIKLKEKLAHFPQDKIDEIGVNITKVFEKKRGLKRTTGEHQIAKEKSKDYSWLKNAIDLYEKRESLSLPKFNIIWLGLGGLSLLAFILLTYVTKVNENWVGVLLLCAFGGLVIYIINQSKLLCHRDAFEDINDIKNAYKEKFNGALTGLSALKATQEEIAAHYYYSKSLQETIDRLNTEIFTLETQIINDFLSLTELKVDIKCFEKKYTEIKNQKSKLKDKLNKSEATLNILDVSPSDYLEEEVSVKYVKDAYEGTSKLLSEVTQQISNEENELYTLKQLLCDETGNKITDDWDEILEKLRLIRNNLYKAYKVLKAQIIAQILVNQSLDTYRAKEDEKIREGLRSKSLLDTLYKLTGKYNKIEMINDELIISDGYVAYPFSDLSTGTQEQIFLALRIGFAAKISKNDSLFFILDDAFQYSDWDKRPLLVEKMIDLAKSGWQIIYFSMDDNIRDIFKKRAVEEFKDEFKLITLCD